MKSATTAVSRRVRLLATIMLACALPGCASMSAHPREVLSTQTAVGALDLYRVPAVLTEYGRRRGLAQRAYRDEVIAVYIQAIDARYDEFVANLDTEHKSMELFFAGALTLLSGAAALSPDDAGDLAVVSGGALAFQGSLNKSLYFERTLTALVAEMDAERFKVRAAIAAHQAHDTADYPLTAALIDLRDYQRAGRLGVAIGALTDKATEARVEAKANFEKRVRLACDTEDAVNVVTAPIQAFKARLYAEAETEEAQDRTTAFARMRSVADAFGVDPAGMNRAELEVAIDDAFAGGFCKAEEVEQLKVRLRQANVGFN